MSNETNDQTIQLADTEPFVSAASATIEKVGAYNIVREIGRGAMGAVYLAEHENLGRAVALKILPPELAVNEDRLKRFQREMVAIGCLEHEHVVLATDAGHADGFFFIAMQFIDGLDLDQLLERQNRLELPAACAIIRQAAMGLQHVHEHNLVHRDIKASNIAISKEGVVKILDLGIARLHRDNDAYSTLTSDQATLGTPDYMAPEQIMGARDVDIRADIYSLGCTLYKLISGHAPFDGPEYQTGAAKMVAHVSDDPRSLEDLCPDLPNGFADLVHRMMSKSPDDRPATPAGVARELAEWSDATGLAQLLSGDASPQTPITPAEPSSITSQRGDSSASDPGTLSKSFLPKSKWAVVATLGGLILAGLLAPMLKSSDDPSTASIASSTQQIAKSNSDIANNTQQMARSLDALRNQFASLNTTTAIEKPATPADLYHNARVFAAKGDYRASRQAFLSYFKNDLGVVDPHLQFIGFLKLQEGLAGAREAYDNLPGDQSLVARRLAAALLEQPELRRGKLESIVNEFPKYAPAWFELGKTWSQSGSGQQSLQKKKKERELLTTFLQLHEQGHLVRHYLDQSEASKIIEIANQRLNSEPVAKSMIANPMRFSVSALLDTNDCLAMFLVAEPCIEISYRIGENGEYQTTGVNKSGPVVQQTGKQPPNPTITFECTSPVTIYAKYVDANGEEQGPFRHNFDPTVARKRLAITCLKDSPVEWTRLHKDGSLYFDLLRNWRGLSAVRYGVGVETPNVACKIPTSDEDYNESDDYNGIQVPATTPYISVQVTYTDGTRSKVVKIKRLNR